MIAHPLQFLRCIVYLGLVTCDTDHVPIMTIGCNRRGLVFEVTLHEALVCKSITWRVISSATAIYKPTYSEFAQRPFELTRNFFLPDKRVSDCGDLGCWKSKFCLEGVCDCEASVRGISFVLVIVPPSAGGNPAACTKESSTGVWIPLHRSKHASSVNL